MEVGEREMNMKKDWTISIDEELYRRLEAKAETEGKSSEEVALELLTEWVGQWGVDYELYIVRPGDTLGGIARRLYGDSSKYTVIADYNGLGDPSLIQPGLVLRIPPLVEAPAPPPPSAPPIVLPTAPTWEELNVSWVPSPHYSERPDQDIWVIVVHATANSTLSGVIAWFQNPSAYLSAHYVIGKDGKIVQMVKDEKRAWHAGESEWKGEHDVNDFSIGIELVNLNDGVDPYPQEQYDSLVALCKYLVAKYNITAEDIVGHFEIAPRRKTDPRGLDMAKLRQDVAGTT